MNNQPYNNDHENVETTTYHAKINVPNESELEAIEYINPLDNPKLRDKRKHMKKQNKSREEIDKEAQDFVFAQPHKEKKNSKLKKVLLIILIILLSLIFLLTSTFFIFKHIGKKSMLDYNNMVINPSPQIQDISNVTNDGKEVTYKGKKYVFNEEIATVVMMGIDKTADETHKVGSGQADAIYIGIIDNRTKKVSILSVSRDAMVDVNIYNTKGEFVRTENQQLCLSYAYGDGSHSSAQNTINSLQRLFYGMQFNTYFALNYYGLHDINDAVGGVTVTATTDFYSYNQNRIVKKGETITLYGADAEQYLRTRDLSALDSNTERMDRQKQYITTFLSKIVPSAKKDITVITRLFNTVNANSTTNLNTSKLTYLASNALSNIDSYKNIEFYSVPGTVVKGEKYAEFNVDQTALWELMLDLFYIEQ